MTYLDYLLVRREIEIMKLCKHPNIVKLYCIIENYDFIHIIMEYIEGGNLFSYIENRGFKISEEQASDYTLKIASAIFYLHSFGIGHRDLKPENILMTDGTDTSNLKIIDFGLGFFLGQGQQIKECYGTVVSVY